ncbi:MAG: glycosyltransferase [Thomasclavelia sp.]|uniref:glycosyltransferase n=1 Tax=Thomasclavelia sp. TaxID=3025757 RepID=UPI0039A3CDC8
MKNILILMGRYLPGYKDGGPVRTIVNLVDILGNEYNFNIMTSDRDHGDKKSYDNIVINDWNAVGKANVYYVKDEKFKLKKIQNIAKNNDLIYCCGPYNSYAIKVMILKRFNIIKQPLVIASMGSFSQGALSLKSRKKKIFLNLLKILGLFKRITWSVTSEIEEEELKEVIGLDAKCIIAEDLPRDTVIKHIRIKQENELKIIFLSRICQKKNLLEAINILKNLNSGKIIFDIYGNKEDIAYWDKCQKALICLPKNIEWQYLGEINSEEVPKIFAKYDIFLFPTFGENYGHVIGEALLSGCVPVISDTTPWLDFNQNKCGNVVSLSNRNEFVDILKKYLHLNNLEYSIYCKNAQSYILNKNKKSINETGYRKVFDL